MWNKVIRKFKETDNEQKMRKKSTSSISLFNANESAEIRIKMIWMHQNESMR
jgi:hypothetical protein